MQTKNITNMKDEWAERPGRGSDQVLITHTARAGLFIFNLHRSGGWHLGIFWVGMCRPGLQIGTPLYKKIPLKLILRSRNGPIFYTPF